eukprot:CAMPEP_0168538884 /NCGR_PEP_ID=MMETSP0405-20121227/21459_1 /TAXON_ID=498012 /ORGANISM="Trichosphaerium sp, Strain Am-I-7 wt" /LENGTH=237 /DNA_ID=CAMNT_0008568263 /DNA_START=151 /DNA_END=868 /DNA_ORIENTATION=-
MTGMVVDCGYGVTHAVPISDGCAVRQAIQSTDIGGKDVTEHLMKILSERGYSFKTAHDKAVARDIKEKLTYVAVNFDEEMQRAAESTQGEKSYTMPDDKVVTNTMSVSDVQSLFCPSLIGKESRGIYEIMFDAMMKSDVYIRKDLKSDVYIRKDLYGNIVLSGGCTMIPGIEDRMHKKTIDYAAPGYNIRVVAMPERKHAAWIGGSILASLSNFQDKCITKQDYDEYGPSIVHKKCL